MLVMMVNMLFMKGHFRSNFVVCVYVTVNRDLSIPFCTVQV